jgi:enoyl-CoA hydratase
VSERTTYDVADGVAVLRLDRPESRNAMDTGMLEELLERLAQAREDDEVRALVLSSTDHMGLSAGADVREPLDEDGKVRRMELFARLYDELTAYPKPTVAACHGSCVGGGAEVAVACDLRVAGSNLRLRFPGAALGVPVGPARLVTLAGLSVAKYLLLTSKDVDGPPGGGRGAPQADAPRMGRDRGALAGRGRRPGRVAAHRPRPAAARLAPTSPF